MSVTPNTRKRLLVGGRVPIGVKEYKAVSADQIEAAATGLGAQQKHKLRRLRVVESVDQALALVDIHRTVEAEESPAPRAQETLKKV